MDARHPSRPCPPARVPSRHRGRGAHPSLAVGILAAALLLAACSGAGAAVSPSAGSSSPAPSAVASERPPASPSPAPSAATFPMTLQDDEGGSVSLAAEPKKVISLTPAVTETLFAVGAGDKVIATTDFDDYPPQVTSLPHVASYTSVDVEKIVGLEPDLVIAGGNGFNDPQAVAKLRTLGIPVLVVYAPDVATVWKDLELVGTAVGRASEAAALTASMQARIDAVKAATASLARPRVFYELDATKDIYGPADDSFLQGMLALAGADPITTGSTTVFSIPLEKLVEADPDIILLGDAAYGVTADQVKARPGWSTMTAVKTGAIRPVNDVVITRPGPRLAEGVEALAVAIHPELAAMFPSPSPAASGGPSATP